MAEETIARFGLGWAGDRGALTAELSRQGIDVEQLADAGLIRRDEETGRTFELFSQRVMFPIRDRRGRIISFGGRIPGAGQPKYVNGPETSVFSKRRNLYGLDLARDGVRNGGTLIVVEGYMDVIATAQAGFTAAVAPLGTALTNEQLEELWRVSPCPVLCFDGDAAGARAALAGDGTGAADADAGTVAEVRHAAGWRGSGQPGAQGRRAGFQAVLDAARSPSDALYDMVRGRDRRRDAGTAGRVADPADRGSGRIADKSLAWEYRDVLLEQFKTHRSRAAPQGRRWDRRREAFGIRRECASHARCCMLHPNRSTSERARILTAILLRHPFLLHDVGHAYNALA